MPAPFSPLMGSPAPQQPLERWRSGPAHRCTSGALERHWRPHWEARAHCCSARRAGSRSAIRSRAGSTHQSGVGPHLQHRPAASAEPLGDCGDPLNSGLRCRGRYRSMATPLLETMEIDMGVRPVPSQQRPAHQPILFPNFYSSSYSSMVGGHSPECTTARVISSQVKTDTDRPDAPAVVSPSRGHL